MMRKSWIAAVGLLLTLCMQDRPYASERVESGPPVIAGWIEPVFIADAKTPISAKLDTGAKTSAINAINLTTYIQNDTRWVKFSIITNLGEVLHIAQPLLRHAQIRRAGTEVTSRPVIVLSICLMGKRGETEFTLADRSTMNNQILIGRSFLAGRVLVDSERENTTTTSCR